MYYLPLGILLLVVLGLILGIVDGVTEARAKLRARAVHADLPPSDRPRITSTLRQPAR